jgi:hypothetical protein
MADAGGPMKTRPAAAQAAAKSWFAQETVAGVHGFSASGACGVDDALPLQVTVARGAAADVHRFVASAHMAGVGIGVGIHRHRLHAEPARSGRDSAGDFPAVGNQDLLKHRWRGSWQSGYC